MEREKGERQMKYGKCSEEVEEKRGKEKTNEIWKV
jgi:hypothetical protein